MQILNLVQGSPEWKATRAKYFTASEAPAMKSESKYKKRDQLLHEKATGEEENFDEFTLKLFAKGHEIEKKARPIAEEIIGETLFPATGVREINGLPLLASFDGLTMCQDIVWECKSWNEEKARYIEDGFVPKTDRAQVVQQLTVSGASKLLYMITDGTKEKTRHLWVELDNLDKIALLGGWNQFKADLADYSVNDKADEKGVSSAIMELPALSVQIEGGVKSTNIAVYQERAEQFIASINTDLKTDDDFATAETTIKFCEATETKLESVKNQALEQTASVDELFKTINFLKEQIRSKRLSLNKAVTTKKAEIKSKIVLNAKEEFLQYQKNTNEQLGGAYVFVDFDIQSAVKNKRTIDSLESAANDCVAEAKIKINATAAAVKENLNLITPEFNFLFSDLASIVTKDLEDFSLIVRTRISDYEDEKAAAIEKAQEDQRIAEAEAAKQVDDKTLDIEDEFKEKGGYPSGENQVTGDPLVLDPINETSPPPITNTKKELIDGISESLKANGIGHKSARKVATLIFEGKIDYVSIKAEK